MMQNTFRKRSTDVTGGAHVTLSYNVEDEFL